MRFGVLGPLAVWTSDGREVRVPELRVRALLVRLLVQRDGPVSADRLVEDLWGPRPPRRPAAALQHKVWRLRGALDEAEPGGRALLVSAPAGYRLDLSAPGPVGMAEPDGTPVAGLDADVFEALVDRARATGDPAARVALLTEALALWRGPAYGDFADEAFVRDAVARLTERRLTAVEEQAEARLALGEHALVAEGLGDLVTRHPLRERLRAAQLRALYLTGRQSEALAGYTELRRRLADELGVDPSPPLAALHRAILSQDPALTAPRDPAPAAALARTVVPPVPVRPLLRAHPAGGLTELIGRETAVGELTAALDAHRLVTLTGPGGVGKTRLALAAAERTGAAHPGGVRFVDLSALPPARGADDPRALELVADVAGVRDDTGPLPSPPGGRPPDLADRVAHALGDRPSLLLLDNCEHVVEPVADLVGRLLRAVPGLRVLTTSQLPLGVHGERLREVAPLAEADAVALFAARAAAVAPFVLDASARERVAAVCRRLDGIPLAIEMAATRVRVLGLRELTARLDDRFRVLSSGVRGAPPRQRTLRAVLDWSWELLGERERTVLARLSVHADGCDLAAAEAVCSSGDVDRAEVLDLLSRLVDGSLVRVHEDGDGPRYRLLESVAAYCAERLAERGGPAGPRRRHREHYTRLAERAAPLLHGPGQRDWLRRLDTENANLRAALDGAVRDGDGERALRLAVALGWYWFLRGRHREAERELSRALATGSGGPDASRGPGASPVPGASPRLVTSGPVVPGGPGGGGSPSPAAGGAPGTEEEPTGAEGESGTDRNRDREPGEGSSGTGRDREPGEDGGSGTDGGPGTARGPEARARLVARAGALLGGVRLALGGHVDPLAEYRAALRGFETVDDPAGLARARWFLGLHLYGVGDAAPAEELMTLALAGFERLGDRWGVAAALAGLAFHAKLRGRFGELRELGERSLGLFTELGDDWGRIQASVPLQSLAEVTGDYPRAESLHRDALRLARELGLWREVSFQFSGLGRIALLTGDPARAAEHHERARRLAVEQSDGFGEQYALTGLALGARRAGDLDGARDGCERVLALHRRLGYEPARPPLILAELGFVARERGDRATALRLQREGLATARAVGDPRAVALAWEGLADALSAGDAGEAAGAARLLGAATAAREAVGVPLPEGERGDVDRVRARVTDVLGADGFATAFARGYADGPGTAADPPVGAPSPTGTDAPTGSAVPGGSG
ncbi:ATP-binding protein [Streptomyces sp. JNUCC 64]